MLRALTKTRGFEALDDSSGTLAGSTFGEFSFVSAELEPPTGSKPWIPRAVQVTTIQTFVDKI
jgi:hypothetical protein